MQSAWLLRKRWLERAQKFNAAAVSGGSLTPLQKSSCIADRAKPNIEFYSIREIGAQSRRVAVLCVSSLSVLQYCSTFVTEPIIAKLQLSQIGAKWPPRQCFNAHTPALACNLELAWHFQWFALATNHHHLCLSHHHHHHHHQNNNHQPTVDNSPPECICPRHHGSSRLTFSIPLS